jgi:hypothetical protein
MQRVLVLLVAALAAGCVGGAAPAGGPAPAAQDTVTGSQLDFTVPAVGGGQIDGGELAGRDLALWFWAPW